MFLSAWAGKAASLGGSRYWGVAKGLTPPPGRYDTPQPWQWQWLLLLCSGPYTSQAVAWICVHRDACFLYPRRVLGTQMVVSPSRICCAWCLDLSSLTGGGMSDPV